MDVRRAQPPDAAAIAAIYNEGIAGGDATFETDPRGPEDVLGWTGEGPPTLVAERDGEVIGWARAFPYSDRCAYGDVGEYAVYVADAAQGAGTGRALLDALIEAASGFGYRKLVGRIVAGNEASVALARRCGFREVGVHQQHGRDLHGRWRDVVVVERLLG